MLSAPGFMEKELAAEVLVDGTPSPVLFLSRVEREARQGRAGRAFEEEGQEKWSETGIGSEASPRGEGRKGERNPPVVLKYPLHRLPVQVLGPAQE